MVLDQQQINDLIEEIDKQVILFSATTAGPQYLSSSEKEVLIKAGVDVDKLYDEYSDITKLNFQLGLLSQALGQASEQITFDQFKRYLQSGQYIPLSEREERSIDSIKNQSLADIRSNKSKIFNDINRVVRQDGLSVRASQEQFLKDRISEGLQNRESVKQISNKLAELTGDWSRNFNKSVQYISHTALNEGRLALIQRRGEGGRAYFIVQKDACDSCKQLYLKSNGEPKVFEVKTLLENGSNIGRNKSEWKPTVEPIHPNCFDDQTEVLTNQGFKFFKDLDKTELFLSTNLQTGNGEWVPAVKWISHPYKGQMYSFQNKNLSLVTSPNHHHVIRTRGNSKLRLVNTIDLPVESQFLKHIPNWIGSDDFEYKFDHIVYDKVLFSKFLGFYLSEGSCIDYKGRLTLHISQSEKKYLSEIFETCCSLFPSVSKQKDYVQIMCGHKPELWQWLREFGKSNVKFVPKQLKESPTALIEIFLDAYCKGDGSFRKGRKWDGYQCKDTRAYYTSSTRMSHDLGELILKIGKSASYVFKQPQSIYDPKRKKSYVQNQGIWIVTELSNKFVHRQTTQQQLLNYDGIIYDVELERNHTLVTRRLGKIVISGNCRCLLTEYKEGTEWNGHRFVVSQEHEYHSPIGRNKIKVTFNGQEYFV